MKIGIVGLGVVGSAVKYGLEKLGHNVTSHDIALGTSIEDLLDAQIVFLCVPTPSNDDGSCNTSIVKEVINNLDELEYSGIIAIKSTVSPGTTQSLIQKYDNNRICFVPEFLRERCASVDFVENHDVCIIGTENERAQEALKEVHGKLPNNIVIVSPTEAELAKYYNNIYNATLVTFANSFYEVCKSLGADYSKVKDAIVNREHIHDIYLDCNDNFRGFGGMCLPKDTKAIAAFCDKNNLGVGFFDSILKENAKYKTTVYDGMREE
jgi:UDPglucose 6-dehydrogenase